MITLSKQARGLQIRTQAGIGGSKRKAFPKDLAKYDVVAIGGNFGSVVTRHIDHVLAGKHSIFLAFDNSINEVTTKRFLYERGEITKMDYFASAKLAMSLMVPTSDGVGVEKIQPEKNSITLKSGRTVQYEKLIIACGQDYDTSVTGFDEGWLGNDNSLFVPAAHPQSKASIKQFRWMHNFNGGNAYFVVPKFPVLGEIELYNWFSSKALWDLYTKCGRLTWANSKVTIMNANQTFCPENKEVDQFIKDRCQAMNIHVEYGVDLAEIDNKNKVATFVDPSGNKLARPFDQMHSLLKAKPYKLIANAGLQAQNGYLDVDIHSLQHKKYDNIFGLGDCCNLPTIKGFTANQYQTHVVRHNVIRSLAGLPPNAKYEGETELSLFLSQTNMTFVKHNYKGSASGNLQWGSSGFLSSLMFKKYMLGKKDVGKYYMFKSWGPPYQKIKKSFDDSGPAAVPVAKTQ